LEKRISNIWNIFVAKSASCHDQYYPTTAKKNAALKDDHYVYPGDPVHSPLECPRVITCHQQWPQDDAANPGLLYRNPLIADILKKTLFRGRDTLPKLFPNDLTITEDGLIEMPAPLVAAAATLVRCFLLG